MLNVFNNAFDTCGITPGSTCSNGYNAYINCTNLDGYYTNRLFSSIGGDVVVTGTYTYDTGPLGDFYQHSTDLINKGTNTADIVGLYHYTTQTNQLKEANSVVDIGYHYVAVDATCSPIDSDGDGVPDYLEDVNGNGVTDVGERPFGITIENPVNGGVFY